MYLATKYIVGSKEIFFTISLIEYNFCADYWVKFTESSLLKTHKTHLFRIFIPKYNTMKISILFSGLVLVWSCQSAITIENITTPPPVVAADKVFSDVYKVLDGTWKGKFKIFEDLDRSAVDTSRLKDLNYSDLEKPSLKLSNLIEVTQIYRSQSPYFQQVWIEDAYADETGKLHTVKSKGVNKVQDGKMWCVVVKPDETVIHQGSRIGDTTIIWQRHLSKPQKVEYFKETVDASTYEIIGYGYYDGDDLNLSPRYWFYGKYERQ